jgi:predicted phosphodiesterase
VNANGGTVSRLFFAVVGDTRPANLDDTDNYPTAVINDVFGLVATLKPQFVLATGDYMFASPSGIEGAEQVGLYQGVVARQLPGGLLFPVMGNQECAGPTASNCAGAPTANTTAYLDTLVKPLGKALPYYALAFDGSDGSWNAKLLVVACNAWDSDQAAWLQQQLASPTTFTLVARHEPSGADAPCVDATDRLLAQTDYDILFVGHAHTFGRSGKTLVVGNGGAPLTGAASFGFATVDQRGSRFLVTQYDSETKAPVAAFFMP